MVDSSSYKPGDIVLTKYGVVVISNTASSLIENGFQGRLWRVPTKSIASASSCTLQFDTILRSLPAAGGMITNLISNDEEATKKVLIWCYSQSSNLYKVSIHKGIAGEKKKTESTEEKTESTKETKLEKEIPTEIFTVRPEQLQESKCGKFYPLLEELMKRGDEVALSSSSFFSKSNIDLVANKSTEILSKASKTTQEVVTKENVEAITGKIKNYIPNKENIQQVYTLMKDEELTDLLKKGQDRLRQLIDVDIPKATEETLNESGISINLTHNKSSAAQSAIALSREKALTALDDLLSEHANTNIEELKLSLNTQFETVFDSLSTAATSDRYLSSIFSNLNDKTSEWQQATGRLMNTKSASLFLEGTQRLQARAAAIFSPEQLFRAKEAGLSLSKAFTEGDAAVAKLKSIELGDAVRSRLISAIEIRSGSKGGLDGIIAEALNSINEKSKISDDAQEQAQLMLANMHDTATSAAKNAHEGLIEVLSQKSKFRDLATLRVERVLVDLDSYLDFTAEDIANIAKGEGGTSAIFEPIARKATKEIEKQLDNADSYVSDPIAKSVLVRVRKLLSGDLTVSALVTEVESVLNDDKIVAYGQTIVQQGERVLDILEDASGYSMMGDVMGIVEKAGLTKEAVIGTVEKLDIDKLIDTAEAAYTNEEVRREMLSSAADSALDFLLKVLPSLPVPPLDGVKDGLLYHLSNLSMEGFKVKKEDIFVEIAGIRASKPVNINTLEKESPNSLKINEKGGISFSSKQSSSFLSARSSDVSGGSSSEYLSGSEKVRATELLIIDIKNISAIMEDVDWSFEQTYFPYLKGIGKAYSELRDGSIRLNFELRRRRVKIVNDSNESDSDQQWEPVLCLHERKCDIGEVTLRLEGGGKVAWVINKLMAFFRGTLKAYVIRTILNLIGNKSGVLLQMLNDSLKDYWGVILRTATLSMTDLAEMSEEDLIEPSLDLNASEIELVWRELLPLGMNLLMNDESGVVKVIDFPRGSQARKVVDLRGFDPDVFKGAAITAVNGTRYDSDSQEELVDALKHPSRPKTVTFELANVEDAERIKRFVSGFVEYADEDTSGIKRKEGTKKTLKVVTVQIVEDGPLGIEFTMSPDDLALVVDGYSKGEEGEALFAENEKKISIGDVLVSINGNYVIGENGSGRKRAVELFEKYGLNRPLTLCFTRPFFHELSIKKESVGDTDLSAELDLIESKHPITKVNRIRLRSIKKIPGIAETSGVFIGDHLIYVNAIPVGAGCRLSKKAGPRHRLEETLALLECLSTIEDKFTLTFARPCQTEKRRRNNFTLEKATTVTITLDHIDELGCELSRGIDTDDVVVKKFQSVQGEFSIFSTCSLPLMNFFLGPFNKVIKDENKWIGMAIESIDGQLVPSFANTKMVLSAVNRSLKDKERAEILFCEDELRDKLKTLK